MPRRSVLLIKSRELYWGELNLALREVGGADVIGEASCPNRGRDLAVALRPDLIFTATKVGGISSLHFLVDVQRGPCGGSNIVLFSNHLDPDDVNLSNELRLAGWLLCAELSTEGLRHALGVLLSGELLVASRPVVDALFNAQHPGKANRAPELTERQIAVLRHVADGRTRLEIAMAEETSPRTVDRILSQLLIRLTAPTPAALVANAYRLGLLA